jgi:hypothetical protein
MIIFKNNSYIKPISDINKLNNSRGKRSEYISYYCKLCDCIHWKTFSESYCIEGEWYCKKAVDSLTNKIQK